MTRLRDRVLPSGAAWGPAAFIAAWASAGLATDGYSAVRQHISELAAIGAPTRPLMNLGFAAFALGVGGAAWPLRQVIGGPAAAAAGVSAASTLAVLLTPLGVSPQNDALHSAFASAGYVSLAATAPLSVAHSGRRAPGGAATSLGVGLLTALCLALSVGGPAGGLFQRLGLGTTDVWLVALEVAKLRSDRYRGGR